MRMQYDKSENQLLLLLYIIFFVTIKFKWNF